MLISYCLPYLIFTMKNSKDLFHVLFTVGVVGIDIAGDEGGLKEEDALMFDQVCM